MVMMLVEVVSGVNVCNLSAKICRWSRLNLQGLESDCLSSPC